MSELIDELWERAIKEHNRGDYHEAHEIFEDIWLELDNRDEKDTVQTLAQADALAVHIETGNFGAVEQNRCRLPLHRSPSIRFTKFVLAKSRDASSVRTNAVPKMLLFSLPSQNPHKEAGPRCTR